ncbi:MULTISPECIES: HAD family hydrolase [Streptomyces]|uniref:HAD-IB family hydrolase n=1 Tax=Streptomyces griseocarneus TaxID=51201 RepID=A0ABX7RTP9_9ACTN|nr:MULTISPECIES: HAD-IB family hydrolase [Streptomyces]QSY50108.1 HAD-IB family hydrolase [Streptomyces griseocarneus]
MSRPERLVFCDVDETLITCKSPFEFLRFYLEGRYGAEGARRAGELRERLVAETAAGVSREEANRVYYRAWRGEPAAEVEAWGRRWLSERLTDGNFFVAGTLVRLDRHRAEGAAVVLVSGSIPALLAPLAETVGARHVLCARMERCGRVFTGRLLGEPVIGEGKRTVVRQLLARYPDIDPADCFGYGDHISDLPMLMEVGHRVAVGEFSGLGQALADAERLAPAAGR